MSTYIKMDFARKQLEKYGWSQGKGLGRNETGISTAIKPKLKFDNSGIGHDTGEEFTNNWWERVFNNAAQNMNVRENGNEMEVKTENKDMEISTKSFSMRKLKKETHLEYGSFIKTTKLTEDGIVNYTVPTLETDSTKQRLSDEELFNACGGRTGHKGARHGLKMTGKLSRIEKQERMLLKKMKKVSLSDETKVEKKLNKLKKQKEIEGEKYTPLDEPDITPSTSQSLKKKIKKRKSVSFNETVTKIYTADHETSFDSEVSLLKEENLDDSNNNNNSGSDEGIEHDLENNSNDHEVDDHKAFEEARLNFRDLSKAERKKLKQKRKFEAKFPSSNDLFLMSVRVDPIEGQTIQEEKDLSTKKRKYLEECDERNNKRCSTESPERLKRNKNKKKKRKQKKEDAKLISSITKSLEGACRISESD